MKDFIKSPKLKNLILNLCIFVSYLLLFNLGLKLATLNFHTSPVWFASGLSIAAFLIWNPKKIAGAIFFASFLPKIISTHDPISSFFIASGGVLEAYLGSLVYIKTSDYFKKSNYLSQINILSAPTIFSGIVGAVASSSIGVGTLYALGIIPQSQVIENFYTWTSANTIGAWLILPLALELHKKLILKDEESDSHTRFSFVLKKNLNSKLNLFAWYFFGLAIYLYCFFWNENILYLFLTGALYLFGIQYISRLHQFLFHLIGSLIAISATWYHYGPFNGPSSNQNLISLQIFLAVVSLILLQLSDYQNKTSFKKPAFILFFGWMLAGYIYHISNQWQEEQSMHRLDALAIEETLNLEHSIELYTNLVSSATGLFANSHKISHDDWQAYVENFLHHGQIKGLRGIGVIFRVAPKNLNAFIELQKKSNNIYQPRFLNPVSEKQDHYMITYIEPIEKNRAALGLDLASEPLRKEAADEAVQKNIITITKKITLVQDNLKRPGFLIYSPFFNSFFKNDHLMDPTEKHVGWVYTPVVYEDFLKSSFKHLPKELAIEVSDPDNENDVIFKVNSKEKPDNNLVSKNFFTKNLYIPIAQKKLKIVWHESSEFENINRLTSIGITALIICITLLLATMVVNLQIGHEQVSDMVSKKTERINILLKTNDQISLSRSTDSLLKRTLFLLRSEFHWDIALYWKWNSELHKLELNQSNYDFSNAQISNFIQKTKEDSGTQNYAIINRVFENIMTENLSLNELLIEDKFTKSRFDGIEMQSLLALPVYTNQNNFGVIELITSKHKEYELEGIEAYQDIGNRIGDHIEKLLNQEALDQQRVKMIQNSKMSALGEMSGSVAHEINNPISIIQMQASLLHESAEQTPDELNELIQLKDSVLQASELITKTTNRIAKIIKGLKTFSRNSSTDPFVKVPISSIIQNTAELCAERFKMNKTQLKLPVVSELLLECHEAQITQVLLNLLNNAFDAVQTQKEKWVEVLIEDQQHNIRILVRDSGPGIPESVAKKMMLPFFTTKEVGKGTGLGLSISINLVESHHGKLFLNTENKQHTEFVIQLPKLQAKSSTPKSTKVAS